MPLINTARGEVWYADARKLDKLPLLLIHGAGATHLDYPGTLRRSDHSTIAPDLCGHGKSPGEGRTTVRDYADDMIALLDALDIERCIVAGHSMGGAITQTLALEYPDRIAGLIIVASGAKLPVNDAILNGIVEKPEETVALIVKWAWAKPLPDETRDLAISRLLEYPVKTMQQDYAACNEFDVRDRLPDIQAPALIIGG
ncbi:MAG: alpha/beta fold hydrolase, partial [Aggregatilineales bacterium]